MAGNARSEMATRVSKASFADTEQGAGLLDMDPSRSLRDGHQPRYCKGQGIPARSATDHRLYAPFTESDALSEGLPGSSKHSAHATNSVQRQLRAERRRRRGNLML